MNLQPILDQVTSVLDGEWIDASASSDIHAAADSDLVNYDIRGCNGSQWC